MSIKEQLQKLSEKYPGNEKIEVSYTGSGDSFDEFYNVEIENEEKYEKFLEDANELLWYAIDNSDADFNDDGSNGSIIFDFVNMRLSIDNYYVVTENVASGEIIFDDQDEI